MAWEPGAAVLWRSVRHGVVRAVQPMRVVRDDEELIALYLCPGTSCRRRKGRRGGPSGRMMLPDGWSGEYEETIWTRNRALILHRPGAAHSVGVLHRDSDGSFGGWYVNLESPWRRTRLGFDTWDHVLDVVVEPDLSWRWKDEDEFAWSQEVGLISPAEAAAIRAEGQRAIETIERRGWPYQDGWERWQPDPTWTVPGLPAGWELVE